MLINKLEAISLFNSQTKKKKHSLQMKPIIKVHFVFFFVLFLTLNVYFFMHEGGGQMG